MRPLPFYKKAARFASLVRQRQRGSGRDRLFSVMSASRLVPISALLSVPPNCAISGCAIRMPPALCVQCAFHTARLAGRRLFHQAVSGTALDALPRTDSHRRPAQAGVLRSRGAQKPLVGTGAETSAGQPVVRARRSEPRQGRRLDAGEGRRVDRHARRDGGAIRTSSSSWGSSFEGSSPFRSLVDSKPPQRWPVPRTASKRLPFPWGESAPRPVPPGREAIPPVGARKTRTWILVGGCTHP